MRHDTPIISTMPVSRSRGSPDQVSHLDATWLTTLIADPTGPGHNLQKLPSWVGVPMCPRTGSESHIGHGGGFIRMKRVEINFAREYGGGFEGCLAALGGAGNDDCFGHCWNFTTRR